MKIKWIDIRKAIPETKPYYEWFKQMITLAGESTNTYSARFAYWWIMMELK